MKRRGLGDLIMTNKTKQNKLSCFIDRYGEKLLKGHDLGKILRLANQKQ
jgi:hypothetical protein